MKYFLNRDKECGLTSISNLLLVQYNDRRIAKRIFNKGRDHPLVLEGGGTYLYTIPHIIRDLSKGKYFAKIYSKEHFFDEAEEKAQRIYGEKVFEIYKQVVIEEKDNFKFITDFENLIPYIGLVKLEDDNHAYVQLEKPSIIDNGIEKDVMVLDLGAAITIHKVPFFERKFF